MAAQPQSAPIYVIPEIPHSAPLTSVAFSPDGTRVLSGSNDKTLKLWDAASGALLRTFTGHGREVHSVAFSPDGTRVLSGSRDNTVKLWDVASGGLLRTFAGHSHSVDAVAFSPNDNGARVLSGSNDYYSGSNDNKLRLWDATTGRLLRSFTGHSMGIVSIAWSPDGTRVLSGSEDKTMKLWDVASGRLLRTYNGHSLRVVSVGFSPDGTRVISGSSDGTFKIWQTASGRLIRAFESDHVLGRDKIISVAFSPNDNGARVLSANLDRTIKLWDAASGRPIRTFVGHLGVVTSVAFSPDGIRILSGSEDWTVRLWDTSSGTQLQSFPRHKEFAHSGVASVAFSPDGARVLSGSDDYTVKLWDAANGVLIRRLVGHSGSPGWSSGTVFSVAFSPNDNGARVLSGSADKTVKLWNAANGALLQSFPERLPLGVNWVFSAAFSPDGKQVLSGSYDKTLKLWDPASRTLLRTFVGHADAVRSVAFSPDGTRLLSGSDDKTVKLWDPASETPLRTLEGHLDQVTSVAFSPNGANVLSGSSDKTLKLWDAATGALIRTFEGHSAGVNSVAFSPNGKQILSGSANRDIFLWDVETGQLLRPFTGHLGEVNSLVFSPDGARALSGGYDGTIRIWSVQTGELLVSLLGGNDGEWIAITPEGFFAASNDGAKASQYVSVVRGFKPYSVMQFYDHLYRPDLVEEALKGDPTGIVKDTASKLNLEKILNSGPAPQIELLPNRTEMSGDTVKLAVRIKDAGGGIGGKVVWRVNGQTKGALTMPGLQGPPTIGRAVVMPQELKVDPSQTNIVEVTAYNGAGLLVSEPFRISIDKFGVLTGERPRLHVLTIGVDKYAMTDYALHYAVKDAKDFGDALKKVGDNLFSEVKVTTLYDAQVNKSGIEAAINELSGEVKATDVFVLFLSGHGKSIAGKYYFLQQDVDFKKGQTIERDAISQDQWQVWLAKIAAQKLLLVFDTCESASAVDLVKDRDITSVRQTAMDQLQHATGQNLIAAARQAAKEGYQGHGVLTYVILEAFQKQQTSASIERVDVIGLAGYVEDRVPEITKNFYGEAQRPSKKLTGNNFPLGLRIIDPPAPNECPNKQEFIVIRKERLRDQPEDNAGGDRVLDLYYRVGVKEIGPWALVCRDGAKLGYLPKEAVVESK